MLNIAPSCARRTVPSDAFPTLDAAVAVASPQGQIAIDILPGHCERLTDCLLLDRLVEIDGPADGSATLIIEQGIICAAPRGAGGTDPGLVLRSLTLRATGGVAALTVASPCSVEFCDISSTGGIGVQFAAGLGNAAGVDSQAPPYLVRNVIHDCAVGLQFAGGLHAKLDRNRVERNNCGATVVALELFEGSSMGLEALAQTHFAENSEVDLRLPSLGVRAAATGSVHRVVDEVALRCFGEAFCAVIRTESNTVMFRTEGAQTHAYIGMEGAEMTGLGILPQRGYFFTDPLPEGVEARGRRERRRDFARLTAPSGGRSEALLVVTPGDLPPTTWERGGAGKVAVAGGSTPAAEADAAAEEFGAWMAGVLEAANLPDQPRLADRCIALLGAGEGVGFATAFGLAPVLLQPHFVLLVSSLGEVRIAWFVLATDTLGPAAAGAHKTSTNGAGRLLLVRLITEDLNSPFATEKAARCGVRLDFVASEAEDDVAQIVARSTGLLRRAADDGQWDLVLGAM